jgi:hypothetical protein
MWHEGLWYCKDKKNRFQPKKNPWRVLNTIKVETYITTKAIEFFFLEKPITIKDIVLGT